MPGIMEMVPGILLSEGKSRLQGKSKYTLNPYSGIFFEKSFK